jgi:DeoR family transcriptional regulator, fructose operon transcriptional repressor
MAVFTMQSVKSKDLAPKRLEELRGILGQDRVVRVEELTGQLGVSAATIRRDLGELEKLGEVRRVYGGAVSTGGRLDEPLFDDKTSVAASEKRRIAETAATYIKPNDTIYLDGGSTVLELARLLKDRSNITIVTNSLRAAVELAGRGPRLILVGGELRRLAQTTVGPLTRFMLQELHVDKAFMGTIGLTLEEGLTTTDPTEAYTKELVMEHAREVILLADSSKAHKISFTRAGRLEKVRVLITDKSIDRRLSKELRKQGMEVVIA